MGGLERNPGPLPRSPSIRRRPGASLVRLPRWLRFAELRRPNRAPCISPRVAILRRSRRVLLRDGSVAPRVAWSRVPGRVRDYEYVLVRAGAIEMHTEYFASFVAY